AGLEDAALGVVFALGAAAPAHALRVLAVVARQALHAGAVVPAVGSGVGAVRVRLAGGVHHAALPGAGPAAHALAVGIAADGVRGIIGGVRAVAVGSGAGVHQLALVVRVAAVETEAARPGVQIAGVLLAVVARQAGRPVPGAGPAAGPAVAIGIVQARRDETAGHGRLAALHVAVRALGGELLGQVATAVRLRRALREVALLARAQNVEIGGLTGLVGAGHARRTAPGDDAGEPLLAVVRRVAGGPALALPDLLHGGAARHAPRTSASVVGRRALLAAHRRDSAQQQQPVESVV